MERQQQRARGKGNRQVGGSIYRSTNIIAGEQDREDLCRAEHATLCQKVEILHRHWGIFLAIAGLQLVLGMIIVGIFAVYHIRQISALELTIIEAKEQYLRHTQYLDKHLIEQLDRHETRMEKAVGEMFKESRYECSAERREMKQSLQDAFTRELQALEQRTAKLLLQMENGNKATKL